MSERKRNIVLAVFLALLIVTLMSFSLTKARYSAEPEADGEYSGDLEYIVSNQIEINSVDEFFNAIENGYTNIQISDDVDNPLVISGGVSDVNSDLTIDLNGHELQRNNREPMLNVTAGVRLTIIDTKGGGGFYNPVGSVLRISGGTLTVAAGLFESGPRNNISLAKREATGTGSEATGTGEYAEVSGATYTTAAGAKLLGTNTVTYYEKGEDGEYGTGIGKTMPVITPKVKKLGDDPETGAPRYHINGNMYFEKKAEAFGIKEDDTYLYYTLEGDNIENTKISTEGSADFYYEYYVTQNADGSVSYYGAAAGADTLKVTVYGYYNVKASANPEGAGASGPNYAAIQMASGNIYVRGGSYTSYFGEANTYCVRATGGYMAASAGVGNFEAHGESECVSIAYNAPAEDEYLRVRGGHFYSEKGNTVSVTGGTMYVTGGDFHKDTTINGVLSEKDPAADEKDPAAGDNNAVIHIGGGKLFVGSADPEGGAASERIQFSLKGSYMYGIASMGEGEVSVTDATFTFNGGEVQSNTATGETDNYGIYAQAGTVTAKGCVFLLPDKNSRGISAERGTLIVGGGGSASAKEGGLATDAYSYFYIDESVGGYGIYAAESGDTSAQANENITITVDAQIFVGQAMTENGTAGYSKLNGAGIYMNAGTNSTITLGNTLVITAGNSVSGIYVAGGKIEQAADKKLVVVTGAKATGYTAGEKSFNDISNKDDYNKDTDLVTANPPRVDVSESQYTYGVYGGGGSVTLGNVYAAVYGTNAAGILTEKGSNITVKGALAMRVSGPSNGSTLSVSGISTEKGDITLNKGADVTVAYGLGITARGGSVTFAGGASEENKNTVNITTGQGTAVYINNGTLSIGSEGNGNITAEIKSTISGTSWATPPPDLQGGVTNQSGGVTNQSDGVYVQGGSLLSYGTFNVTHTGVANESQNSKFDADQLFINFKYKSFAVRVETSSEANTATNVVIGKGTIESVVVEDENGSQTGGGGGLYVGYPDGVSTGSATVTLGDDGGTASDLSITTEGNVLYDGYIPYQSGNWQYRQSKTGGPAVEVNGGTLQIRSGSYSAAQGDGIRVKNGMVTITGGTFKGNDNYKAQNNEVMAGPAASYAFKMLGGKVNIFNGYFGCNEDGTELASGSGAFVMGTAADEKAMADANIYGGTFRVAGQAAFSVFQYVDVEFTPKKTVDEHTDSDITVVGGQAGMTIEYRVGGNNNTSVVVNGGTFSAVNADKSNGIWYGEATSALTINGGTFGMYNNQKVYNSGLYFEAKPDSGKVQLSGGTYYGNADRAYGYSGIFGTKLYPYYNNGAISAPCSRNGVSTWSGIGSEIEVGDILVGGYTAACSGEYISSGDISDNYNSNSSEILGESFGGTDQITIS